MNAPRGSEPTPSELAARAAIEDIVMRYFIALDRRDWPMVQACFHEDATARYDERELGPGSDSILQFMRAGSHSSFDSATHTVASTHSSGSRSIVVDGNVARVETYATAYLFRASEENPPHQVLVRGIRYLDFFERRHGVWRISRRVHTADWMFAATPEFAVRHGDRVRWETAGTAGP